jgi:hypothetical protein
MVAVRTLAVLAASSFLAMLAGCATTHGSLTSSAERLERNSDVLARNARDDSYGYSGYSRDARQLADQAHDFRRTLNDRRADERDIRGAFEDLSRGYHSLRDEVDRANNREADLDLRPVTEAYLDVERAMGGYRYSSRSTRDGDSRDRF